MSTPTNNSIFNPGFSDSNLNHLSENSVSASVSSTQKMQSKVLFGGGVSDSSQQQGELISFVNPIERGVSLVLVRSVQGLCCANVGTSGAKMCFRQSRDLGNCPASHARNKADLGLASPTLFRVDAGATSCTLIICPRLEVHDIDDSAIQVMLGGQYSEEAWSEEVRAHEGARTVNKSVEVFKEEVRRELSSIQTPLLRKKLAQSATPGKMDRHEVERLRLETLQYIHEEAHKEVTGPISTAVKDTTLYLQDKQFRDHFEAVEHRDDALIKVLTSTRKLISYGLEAVADDIIDVNDVLTVVKHDLQSIKERVGVKIADPGTLDGLTVWEAIKKLCDFVESTGLVALQESGISLATTSYIEAMIDGNTPLGVMLASHTNKIEGLETALRTLAAQGRDGSLFANPSPANTSVASNADFLELLEKVTQLEKRLASSQTVGSDMTVQFRGHIFNSQHDVNNFMKSCIGSSSVPASLINDAYTLLNAVAKGMTGQVMDLKDIYSVSRMGDITEADLQNAIAGNQTGVPPFFRGGPKAAGTPVYTGTGTGPKNRLKGIPDYAAWGNPGSTDGIRYKALLELDRIVQSTRNDIQARVSDPTISQFLEHMLSRSHEFIRKLFDFITDTYASLIQTFENSTSTWDFVCHCVEHIFMHEFDVARSILRGHDVKSEQFNERMLWTSLRTVVIQETFLSKTFQNHDSLSGAYSTFLLKNSQSAEVNSMKRKLEKMESVVESLNSKIAKFDSKVKGAEGAADKAWPVCSFVAASLGHKKIVTYVAGASVKTRNVLMKTEIGPSLRSGKFVLEEIDQSSAQDECWIQGSAAFAEDMVKRIRASNSAASVHIILSDVPQNKPIKADILRKDCNWSSLSHSTVGGILKGSWKVGRTGQWKDWASLHAKSQVTPGIRDILHTVNEGTPVSKDSSTAHLPTGLDLLPRKDIHKVTILSPSVFSPTKWCTRCLTPDEIMNSFDIDFDVRALLKDVYTADELPFLLQPPAKLVYRVMQNSFLHPEGSAATPSTIPSVVPSAKIPCVGLFSSTDAAEKDHTDTSMAHVNSARVDDVSMDEEDLNLRAAASFLKTSSLHPKKSVATPSSIPSVDPIKNSPSGGPFLSTPASIPPIQRKRQVEAGSPDIGHADASTAQAKAARADDAPVDEEEWNLRAAAAAFETFPSGMDTSMFSPHRKAFNVLRKGMLRWYNKNLRKSFTRYLVQSYGTRWPELRSEKMSKRYLATSRPTRDDKIIIELKKDLVVGQEALTRASLSTFMDWSGGSTLYFWRWPSDYQKQARDGLDVYVSGKLPSYWAKQRFPKDFTKQQQMRQKLGKVCTNLDDPTDYVNHRAYIVAGFIYSLTGCFDVPKGAHDIRMVYDATKSLLNEALWAPNFMLPDIDSVLNNCTLTSWFGDIDLGEMFLNYFLDPKIRPYAGVDVTGIADILRDRPLEEQKRLLLRWERSLMGLKSSPYNCTRAFAWSEDFIRGDRHDPTNPFAWDKVIMNLPGQADYNPTLPWVFRYDSVNEKVAAFFCTYVDDIRSGDSTEAACIRTTHTIASRVNYLGQQDAPRKRRKISQSPGAWSGAMIKVLNGEGLFVTCSQEKWDKTRGIITRILDSNTGGGGWSLDRKALEKDRGFLIHIARTFPMMVPYLRRIHNTLESWRLGRDREGWTFSASDWVQYLAEVADDFNPEKKQERKAWKDWKVKLVASEQSPDAPANVNAVEGLWEDMLALDALFSDHYPTERLVRGNKIMRVVYGFGDASGSGFGGTWESKEGIRYRFGLWGSDLDDSSSNNRELRNLSDMLDQMEKDGDLAGAEIFIFTDNSTAERAFFKGSSKSKILHGLVLRLRLLEMRSKVKIHFVHVAGTRMQGQGSDALSRGNLTEGVMRGEAMTSFIPLHLSAFDRSNEVKDWISSWLNAGSQPIEYLDPVGWFDRGQDLDNGTHNCDGMWVPKYKKGLFVWSPPPAAAHIALEELRRARHKRQDSTHIFVCPRLMYPYWQRHIFRAADLIVEIKAGQIPEWPSEMHEPLILAFFFPFIRCKPWQLKGCPKLLEMEIVLRRLFKNDPGATGSVLRKLCKFTEGIKDLSAELVWSLLQKRQGLKLPSPKSRKRRGPQMEKEER